MLDFITGLMLTEIKEQIKEMTDEAVEATLEAAKGLRIKEIEAFINLNANDLSFSTGNIKDLKMKKYQMVDASQETLEKLLSGKIREKAQLDRLKELNEKKDGEIYRQSENQSYKSSLKYKILHRREYDERIADDIFIIETIFLKN